MLPLRPTRRAPKSSSRAMRESASSNNSVSEVTCARFLAASINSEGTRPERRVFLTVRKTGILDGAKEAGGFGLLDHGPIAG